MNKKIRQISIILCSAFLATASFISVGAETRRMEGFKTGGGYAVTGQLPEVGYMAALYDASNGLPTSDANFILSTRAGYILIGSYAGIIRYDGSNFERMDATDGLTSGRVMFEDSIGRIWVGTNDNGIVMLEGQTSVRYTYKDGLPSSSIRSFAESSDGVIYIGSTEGVSYIGSDMTLKNIEDERISKASIIRLVTDSNGDVYGNTKDGSIFSISSGEISRFFTADELGTGNISAIFPDPVKKGNFYFGTEDDRLYYGSFGDDRSLLSVIETPSSGKCDWITYACDRIWVCSKNQAGYLDGRKEYHPLVDVPMDNSIEMMTADYQGNLWFASSRQGVMKIVTNNFFDVYEAAGLEHEVVNATCMYKDRLYIGTDNGLRVLDADYNPVDDKLAEYLGDTRIRCLERDEKGNLWVSAYTNGFGVVCMSSGGNIVSFNEASGLKNDQIRCTRVATDGSILVGCNDGLAVIKDQRVVKCKGASDNISNSTFLTVEEFDGKIYAGSDGDGIYVIDGDEITNIGRYDGLQSDVVLRLKRDDVRNILWIITSNSIEYLKDGKITTVSSFPYNNNFDLFIDSEDVMWILSSYGIYCVEVEDMIEDNVTDYKLYRTENGLPVTPTANAYSDHEEKGYLYIAGRTGVGRVNIDRYFEQMSRVKTGIRSLKCDDTEVLPEYGNYVIPPSQGRIQIVPAVLDYTMINPTVKVYLEGSGEEGEVADRSSLKPLEYTGLKYGNYTLHIQILDKRTGSLIQDDMYEIEKKPRFLELMGVRIMLIALIAALAGLIVWRVMNGTVVRRQYIEIMNARDEAQRASSAKTRFLANMSHEIRTPINTIMGMDEMILREDTKDVPKKYLSSVSGYALDIKSASESLLSLINDLLDMSKIESGKMNVVEAEYDSADLFRSIVRMIRVRAREKDLTFDVDIDEKLPRRMYGDSAKIKQIMLNLLTNAAKYTNVGGFTLKVKVELKTDDKVSLWMSVKDTGIGIKSEDMDKLFTAYERFDEQKNIAIQGTGLGLDISRRFAELMGGRLWCESVYKEGSEFIFTVTQQVRDGAGIGQFKEIDESEQGPYIPQFVAPDADILVVDDNPMNLNVIKGLLKATKVFVTTAESGEECLEKIKYDKYDVVLLDHMMPGMDGLETVEKIRETHPDLPVYALTANAAAGGEEFYKSKGFNGYLSKPVDSVALELAIMKHLPEEIMMRPKDASSDTQKAPEQLPEDMKWTQNVEGISTADGIRYSGGVSSFVNALKMFADTIDENSKVIEDAYSAGDIKLYTIKVHALKSNARIIGAQSLSDLALKLEDAGNAGNKSFIKENTDKLLEMYRAYKEKLAPLGAKEDTSKEDKKVIPEDELKGAYDALREVIPQMDYDSVEMIVNQVGEFSLPDEDAKFFEKLSSLMKKLDWDAMEKLIGDK
ncbi:MAG: response regulator [Lachnospiraceae bacterium]|nr:response regulator [Lachnospiraceae bacterium]